MEIYTIGHSNHSWETFATLLKNHDIQLLVDVRSNPVSRWARFANKGSLPGLLEGEGIRHVYMGDSLGGKPSDRSFYDDEGKPDYTKISAEGSFHQALGELLVLAERSRVVLMCAEEDPRNCHRSLLLRPALEGNGVLLLDIRKGGAVQESE